MENLFGYLPAEMLGRKPAEFMPPGELAQVNAWIAGHQLADGTVRGLEHRSVTKSGQIFWQQVAMKPVRDAAGNITGHRGTGVDITERRQAEAGRARLAAIVENSSDAIYSRALDGTILSWNAGAQRIFGYTAAEAIGKPATFTLLPGEDSNRIRSNEHLLREEVFSHESKRMTKDGRVIDVLTSVSPVKDGAGNVVGASVIQQDITERKRSELMQAQLADIVKSSNDAIVARAPDDTIISWNVAAERMFGWSAQEALGKKFRSLLSQTPDANRQRRFERVLRGETVAVVEDVRLRKDGSSIQVETTVSAVRDKQENIVFVSCIMRDVTDRKQAEAARASLEAQLREAQKMEAIGTLAGGIAHDFNNIIAAILGNTELAHQDARANAAVLDSLMEIRKAGLRARDLVQQILAFSRRQPTELKLTALAAVVEDAVHLLRATLPARIGLDVHCATDVPLVLADATLIQQALINLATNAMQAMQGQPGRIRIQLDTVMLDAALVQFYPALREMQAQHPGRTVRLAVSDNGPGMDAATQARIFEPFFTTKPAGEGTGLGLSVVHGIVQKHEGAIVVQSQPGQGSTFTLYLPLAEVRSGESESDERILMPTQALILGGGQHILYVDDDEALVYLLERLLTRRGYRVSTYTNQNEALAALRADPTAFDLVVTDYNMPGMSGLDVAREVRAIRADLPVAVTSGFIDETLRAQALSAGVRELIFKVNDVEEICATILQLVEGVRK